MRKIRTADDLRKEMDDQNEPFTPLVETWLAWLDKEHFGKLKHRDEYISWQVFPRIRTPLSGGRIAASRRMLVRELIAAGFSVQEESHDNIDAGIRIKCIHVESEGAEEVDYEEWVDLFEWQIENTESGIPFRFHKEEDPLGVSDPPHEYLLTYGPNGEPIDSDSCLVVERKTGVMVRVSYSEVGHVLPLKTRSSERS